MKNMTPSAHFIAGNILRSLDHNHTDLWIQRGPEIVSWVEVTCSLYRHLNPSSSFLKTWLDNPFKLGEMGVYDVLQWLPTRGWEGVTAKPCCLLVTRVKDLGRYTAAADLFEFARKGLAVTLLSPGRALLDSGGHLIDHPEKAVVIIERIDFTLPADH